MLLLHYGWDVVVRVKKEELSVVTIWYKLCCLIFSYPLLFEGKCVWAHLMPCKNDSLHLKSTPPLLPLSVIVKAWECVFVFVGVLSVPCLQYLWNEQCKWNYKAKAALIILPLPSLVKVKIISPFKNKPQTLENAEADKSFLYNTDWSKINQGQSWAFTKRINGFNQFLIWYGRICLDRFPKR